MSSLLASVSLLVASIAPANALLAPRTLVVATDLPVNWTYQGCYSDSVSARTLTAAVNIQPSSTTQEACIAFCQNRGFTYAGVEYSQECYCGNELENNSTTVAAADCNMACTGNSLEVCGGSNALTLFAGTADSAPTTNNGTGNWTFVSCYSDVVSARTLPTQVAVDGGNSAESCTAACETAGFDIAGLEYSSECWCSNSIENSGAPVNDGCTYTCSGNPAEICGGANRLSLYALPDANLNSSTSSNSTSNSTSTNSGDPSPVGDWTFTGCYPEDILNGISDYAFVNIGSNSINVENCTTFCQNDNFTFTELGTEFGDSVCYCFNMLSGTAVDNGNCSTPCQGNANETCGTFDPSYVDVYTFSNTTTPSAPSGPATVQSTGLWNFAGCYTDDVNDRTLVNRVGVNGGIDIESCTTACQAANYSIAGTEYSSECYCADAFAGNGIAISSGCDYTCAGNSSEICGGSNRLSAYIFNGTSVAPTPTLSNGTWSALGCYNDSVTARVLTTTISLPNVTIESCEAACQSSAFEYSGVEYAQECYCGNTIANDGVPTADGCTDPCVGNSAEICGGSNRINIFQFQAS